MRRHRESPRRIDATSEWHASELLGAIVDCSPEPIIAKDTSFRLRFCNRAFLELTHRQADELLGRPESESGWLPERATSLDRTVDDGSEPEDRDALGGKTVFIPSRRYLVSGAPRYFDITRSPIRDSEEGIIGILCVWHDVTTFHTAVEELREAAERYRAMSEYSYEWEAWQNAEGQILYISPSFERITGYSLPDFLADPELISTIVHPDDRSRYEEHRRQTVPNREVESEHQIRFRIVRPGGEVRWIEHSCRSAFRGDGTFLGRRSSNRDITETRLAEERLKASEQKFRLVFENSPLGKSVTTVDGYLEVNRAFCELLGYQEEELMSKTWREITHPDDIAATERAIAPLLAGTAAVARFEKRYLHKSGRIVGVEVITVLQRDEQGAPQFFITTIRELSERDEGR